MAKTRLTLARSEIIEHIEALPTRIFRLGNLQGMLAANRDQWRLTQSLTGNEFIEYLCKRTQLNRVTLSFPSRTEVRFCWGKVSPYEVANSLRPLSYFSHFSAVHLNQLTEQIPKVLYVNCEQTPKPRSDTVLRQDRVEAAFKRPQRMSRNVAEYRGYKIILVSGMHTGQLGVVAMKGPGGEDLRVTNIERTLIDIAVRPAYAGGVFEVLKAYRLAQDRVSTNRLSAMYSQLDYLYPYHQAIGFYLEKAGVYSESRIRLMEKFPISLDFYLTHNVSKSELTYSPRWRLFHPKGL